MPFLVGLSPPFLYFELIGHFQVEPSPTPTIKGRKWWRLSLFLIFWGERRVKKETKANDC
uniref:ATP synthase protein 8 n=1 Tax=Oenothera berteroana TaxID=3950 RepID=ATP8_OENBE|nr:RecName: Full=ATP synthase protein 8; AltName: Full=A6L; AltName: Full=F-ATPase subunit 8 [Oenothera berteroana]pir/A27210/ hypothetical protein (COII 5' region) - evening primrose mitochondrion [Oenothera villaricae]